MEEAADEDAIDGASIFVVDTKRVDPVETDDVLVPESAVLDGSADFMTFPTLADGQVVKVAFSADSQGVASCTLPTHQGPLTLFPGDPQNHMVAHEPGWTLEAPSQI